MLIVFLKCRHAENANALPMGVLGRYLLGYWTPKSPFLRTIVIIMMTLYSNGSRKGIICFAGHN
jgi:hypothetical protein